MTLTPELMRLITRMPKADLRARVEGSAAREASLRSPGPISLSEIISESSDDNRRAPAGSFSDSPTLAMAPLSRADDFYEATLSRLRADEAQGCLHVEIVFDPGAHLTRGAALESAMDGILNAMERAAIDQRISAGMILSLSNYPKGGRASAAAALERCAPFLPRVLALEIDASDPASLDPIPPELLRAMIKADGSAPRLIARAGPQGLCEHILKALEGAGALRIERAGRCLQSPRLALRLARERVALTVCPLADIEDGAVDLLVSHPLAGMLDAGLLVALGSDRPAHQASRINDHLIAVFDALGLSLSHARQLALNSFEASLMRAPAKARAIEQTRAFFDREEAAGADSAR